MHTGSRCCLGKGVLVMCILRGSLSSEMRLLCGTGTGYDNGNGNGYGYGDGYGDGDGNGNGYGDDSDSIIYWMQSLPMLDTAIDKAGAILAYWLSNADGTPANGGSGTKARVGLVEEISGPLKICTKNALHGTLKPPKWSGE